MTEIQKPPDVEGFWKTLGRWIFASLFIAGGIGHFVATGFYLKLMPDYLPWHTFLVLLSGVFEIGLGILLFIPKTKRLAGWGLALLLIAVFPANVHMYLNQEMFDLPSWALLLRLPLQGVLIAWALVYTKR